MATVSEIYKGLDQKAPFSTQMSFDNAGFLVGDGTREVTKTMVSLDITNWVIDEAVEQGCQLIVSHHPVLFHPAKAVTDSDTVGRKLLKLARHEIAAICAHTNLDIAAGGVNDALAAAAGLTDTAVLEPFGEDKDGNSIGMGRLGVLSTGKPLDLPAYASQIKGALGANGIRYVDGNRPVFHVAVGGGSCGDMLDLAIGAGCDTFLTADIKYDVFLKAAESGINLIDAGHFPTENVVCPVVANWLKEAFPTLTVMISKSHHEVLSYL